jgi:hypothetical protein
MHYKADLKMYTSVKPVHLIDQLQANCWLSKDGYYTKIGPVEVVKNSRYQLTIDHDDKLVVLAGAQDTKDKLKDLLTGMGALLEGMKGGGVRVQKIMRGNDTWLELSQLSDPEMQQCNIQYDPVTFSIKRLWLKVLDVSQSETDPVIVDIVYNYDRQLPVADQFSEAKYVRVSGKQIVLQSPYQQYTLINQL